MKVSVITCTYNRATQMLNGLKSLINQEIKPDELIIVNDGSTDETQSAVDVIQQLCVKNYIDLKYIYLDHPAPRISCIPRNIGIQEATGDVIIFTESEALHVNNTIEQLLTDMEIYPDHVILASQVWSIGQRIQQKLNEGELAHPARIISHPYAQLVKGDMQNTNAPDSDFAITGEANCNAGVLFAAKREWLIKAGGFDESFKGHGWDDFDLFNRLGHLGYPLHKDPNIAVLHQWHEKNYPYNIYEAAERNGKISEANIKAGNYVVNPGKKWGQL